jgi:threonine/homoserine/homoserine lactone efflux protein
MTWATWSVFLATETVLCLTPGPAVLFVVSHGLGRGPRSARWAALGILAGNTLYFAVSATSLGAILVTSYALFSAIRWLGAAYLVWLGCAAILGRRGALAVTAAAGADTDTRMRVLGRGFVVQAANPKALVFFVALLPQFIDPAHNVPAQVAILAATSTLVELAVLMVYGSLAARAARLVARPRAAALLERVAGGLLIAAGLRLAALGRAELAPVGAQG